MTETKLKRKFREAVGVWSETYETRSGGGVGYPDLQLLVHSILVPVELKVGGVKGMVLRSSAIRPSQINWHHEFKLAGGKAYIVVAGLVHGLLEAWAIPDVDRLTTSRWKVGWGVYDCTQWVRRGELIIDLVDLLPNITDKR